MAWYNKYCTDTNYTPKPMEPAATLMVVYSDNMYCSIALPKENNEKSRQTTERKQKRGHLGFT